MFARAVASHIIPLWDIVPLWDNVRGDVGHGLEPGRVHLKSFWG